MNLFRCKGLRLSFGLEDGAGLGCCAMAVLYERQTAVVHFDLHVIASLVLAQNCNVQVGNAPGRIVTHASMPRLTRLRGAYKSNEIAVKGEAMYREGLVKDWVKPRGASGPKQTHGGG